jgi:acetyl esterase
MPPSPLDLTASPVVDTFDREYLRHSDAALLATIYQPEGLGPFPMMVAVHGGAWNLGSRSSTDTICRELASSGVVVAAVDFRLAPDHPYPAQVQDVNFACRWLKLHAREFNGDAAAVGVWGSSSGGHTALLCAMRPRDMRYSALRLDTDAEMDGSFQFVITCWGVIDPWARYVFAQTTPAAGSGFGGAELKLRQTMNYFGDEATIHEGNPQEMLERSEAQELPPVLIVQGTEDMNIPLTLPQRFAPVYRTAGGTIQVEWFPGQAHEFTRRPGPATTRAINVMKQFVASQTLRSAVPRPSVIPCIPTLMPHGHDLGRSAMSTQPERCQL